MRFEKIPDDALGVHVAAGLAHNESKGEAGAHRPGMTSVLNEVVQTRISELKNDSFSA